MSGLGARTEYKSDIDVRLGQWVAHQTVNRLDFMSELDIDVHPYTIRNSGIICTVGR